ncbi:MAG: T9SS type A sorting domain-containing protein [Crocinitomicaceae bacterium]
MKFGLTLISFGLFNLSFSQSTALVTPLAQDLSEASGLIYLNNNLVTHNDSGAEAALYEIDTLTGEFSRKVIVSNASNNDWEDIANDDTYIYIGDFGNNDGTRTDLKIYRILKSDYINTVNDTVQSEIINFNYSDQTSFISNEFSTNFDAEAMIAFNDTLYIFTKNWGNYKSNVYSVPNQPGTYSISKIDSLNPQGLVTGATYNPMTESLMLCGYQTSFFIFEASGITPPYFSSGNSQKTILPVQNSFQIEGITSIGANYYFSAEQNLFGAASLYRLNHSSTNNLSEKSEWSVKVYPNPCQDYLIIETDYKDFEIMIFDSTGKVVLRSLNAFIDCSRLSNGIYMIKCVDNDNKTVMITEKFIME